MGCVLPDPVPEPVGLTFGERDRRLAAATDVAGEAADEDPIVVTDNVDFVENLKSEDVLGPREVWPVGSGELLLSLHRCGAMVIFPIATQPVRGDRPR
jgi:hypothetical protein